MPALRDQPLRALLEKFSAPDPTPGGGSASALAGGLAASLLVMVARMPKTRHNTDEERQTLGRAAVALAAERDRLIELIEKDSTAYDAVVAAYRLPRSTNDEKQARQAAVQTALTGATEVPLDIMRACAETAETGVEVAATGNPAAASDVGVAFELVRAGFQGALLNVGINLEGISDAAFVAETRTEQARLEERLERAVKEARSRANPQN